MCVCVCVCVTLTGRSVGWVSVFVRLCSCLCLLSSHQYGRTAIAIVINLSRWIGNGNGIVLLNFPGGNRARGGICGATHYLLITCCDETRLTGASLVTVRSWIDPSFRKRPLTK